VLFSHRKGLEPVRKAIQLDSIDYELRVGLWNGLTLVYWNQVDGSISYSVATYSDLYSAVRRLWLNYFKKPIDTLDDYWPNTLKELRDYFFKCPWNKLYDFIEFVANNFPGVSKVLTLRTLVLSITLTQSSNVNRPPIVL